MKLILTDEEKQLILDKRAKEESEKPKKSGQLKHDLYFVAHNDVGFLRDSRYSFVTQQQIDDLIELIKCNFVLTVPKGTKFICFIEHNNESWYDDEGYGVEEMSKYWANDHLEEFQSL